MTGPLKAPAPVSWPAGSSRQRTAAAGATIQIDQFPPRSNGERPARYEGTHEAGAATFDVLNELLRLNGDQIADLPGANALR